VLSFRGTDYSMTSRFGNLHDTIISRSNRSHEEHCYSERLDAFAISRKKQIHRPTHMRYLKHDYNAVRKKELIVTIDAITEHMPPAKGFRIHEIIKS
jgi:hypothetical protein